MSKYNPKTWLDKVAYMRREFWAAFCVAAAVSLCAGCANICYHVEGNSFPYCGTVIDAEVISTAFRSPRGVEGVQAKALSILLLPVWIVDLPLEVVADTVTLPYDLLKVEKKVESRK